MNPVTERADFFFAVRFAMVIEDLGAFLNGKQGNGRRPGSPRIGGAQQKSKGLRFSVPGSCEFVFGDVSCVDDLAILNLQGQVFKPVSGKQLLQPVATNGLALMFQVQPLRLAGIVHVHMNRTNVLLPHCPNGRGFVNGDGLMGKGTVGSQGR